MTNKTEFNGGTAVITGAGSGLGQSLAQRFANVGMSVVALDIDSEQAEKTAISIRESGGKALAMAVDVSDRAALETAAKKVEETFLN